MKTINFSLKPLALMIVASYYLSPIIITNSKEIMKSHFDSEVLYRNIVWLEKTIGSQNYAKVREELVESITELETSLQVWPCQATKEMNQSLIVLFKNETSTTILEYLALIAGKLSTKKIVPSLLAVFYRSTQHQSLCCTIIEALKRIKSTEALKLVPYAVQHCCTSVCKQALELPFHLKSEEKIMEDLLELLRCYYHKAPIATKLKFFDAITYIKNRDFAGYSNRKKPEFTAKVIQGFANILEYEKNSLAINKCMNLLLTGSSPRVYHTLLQKLKDNKIVSPLAKSCMIIWLTRSPAKKQMKSILLREVKSKFPEVQTSAIKGLKNYLKQEVTIILLEELAMSIDACEKRKNLIEVLGGAPLLKHEQSRLFYNSSMSWKKNIFLRNKMISTFRMVLGKINMCYVLHPQITCMTPEACSLVRYLSYLKDESINDHLWDMLQSQKSEGIYLYPRLRYSYLRLYSQAPIFFLNFSSTEKLVDLYIRSLALPFNNSFPSDLLSVVFSYLAIHIKKRLVYECLPLTYTGTDKQILNRYPHTNYLEKCKLEK